MGILIFWIVLLVIEIGLSVFYYKKCCNTDEEKDKFLWGISYGVWFAIAALAIRILI